MPAIGSTELLMSTLICCFCRNQLQYTADTCALFRKVVYRKTYRGYNVGSFSIHKYRTACLSDTIKGCVSQDILFISGLQCQFTLNTHIQDGMFPCYDQRLCIARHSPKTRLNSIHIYQADTCAEQWLCIGTWEHVHGQ